MRWVARGCSAARSSRWLGAAVVVAAVAAAVVNFSNAPKAAMFPALLGLLPWTIGKFVLCPLRWHALSASGQRRRWHLRVYAESELLGMLSPAHAGADLWRMQMLHKTGMDRPSAVADVALDRLVGSVALIVFVVMAGATLPPQLLAVAFGLAVAALTIALAVRRRRPGLLASRPRPPAKAVIRGVLLSLVYQATTIVLLLATVSAVGHEVSPIALLGVFGASQVAGIVPGVHGAGPREGALVAGLVAIGVPFGSALGAISLSAVLTWLPALLLGGSCLVLRHAVQGSRRASALVRPLG